MKYNYTYKIPYQEVDMDRRLRLYRLENYLLTVAGEASDEGGYGIQALLPYGLTWVITRLQLELLYLPTHGDEIIIETWVEQNQHMLSTRNYRIYLSRSSSTHNILTPLLIGQAKSIWTVLDIEKREIVNAFSMPIFANAEDGENLSVRKLRLLPITQPTGTAEHTILYSDIDYNGHCNSCKYLEMMINASRPAFLQPKNWLSSPLEKTSSNQTNYLRLDINYSKEAHLGDTLTIFYKQEGQAISYSLKTSSGLTSCSARIGIETL